MKIYDYNGKANIVGKKILELRKQQKLSQEELAAKMQLNNIEISQKSSVVLRNKNDLLHTMIYWHFLEYSVLIYTTS